MIDGHGFGKEVFDTSYASESNYTASYMTQRTQMRQGLVGLMHQPFDLVETYLQAKNVLLTRHYHTYLDR